VIAETALPPMVEQLRDASLFFKFATRYAADLRTIPADFRVDDELLRRFEEFAVGNTDAATSGALVRTKDLYEAAKKEGYQDEVLRKIESIQSDIAAEQRRAFSRYREEIRGELYNEIVARFRSQRDRMAATLPSDRQVQAAVGLLLSGHRVYGRLLSAK
jgi:hypothetical protein